MPKTVCPGCGVELQSSVLTLDVRYNASCACLNLFNELTAFTLVNAGKDFIHQISLDAYTAQHTGPKIKPIGISFALIGLYLAFERGYTGRQVQLAHMALAKTRRDWPRFEPPKAKAEITVADVVKGLTAANHRERISAWGKAVWKTWAAERERMAGLAGRNLT